MGCRDILLIEDDPGIRETMRELLELEGFCVRTADNGHSGLEALDQLGRPCLILLDLMMPVMDGWQFLDVLRRLDGIGDVPVAVVSAAADLADVQRRYACDVLQKPVDLPRLIATAHRFCDCEAA